MLVSKKAQDALALKIGTAPVVYLDDGHGYDPETGVATPGKRTPAMPDGAVVYENAFNDAVVRMTGSLLAYHGFRVVPTSPEKSDTTLHDRVQRVNDDWTRAGKPRAVFLSVHYNALNGVFDKKSGGVETFHYPGAVAGKKLAELVQKNLLGGTRQANRGVKTAGFYVLRYTAMPAALAECGFMDNLAEAGRMLSLSYQTECARELATAVLEYFAVPVDHKIFRAYAAVEKAHAEDRLENEQYWMDVAMGHVVASAENIVCLMEG